MKLEGRTVLVTGATAGIGAAMVDQLLAKGCAVIACGRQQAALDALARKPGVTVFALDLQDPASIAQLVAEVRARHPALSVLINNAGIQHEIDIAQTPLARTLEVSAIETAVNYSGPIALTLQLLDVLRAQPQAAVVNVTTPLAMSPKRSSPFYSATKSGLRAFTRALRYQCERDLPALAIVEAQPPLVDTGMTRGRGTGKISPEAAAAGILRGIERGQREILVGKARILFFLSRWLPPVAEAITRRW